MSLGEDTDPSVRVRFVFSEEGILLTATSRLGTTSRWFEDCENLHQTDAGPNLVGGVEMFEAVSHGNEEGE